MMNAVCWLACPVQRTFHFDFSFKYQSVACVEYQQKKNAKQITFLKCKTCNA